MKIIDENGRIGIVTEVRDEGVFARPEGTAPEIKDRNGITGVAGAVLLTPTWWQKNGDAYTGLWYDSPLHINLTAKIK